jgi:hypothetical protein
MMTRVARWFPLKPWAMRVAARRGAKRAKVALGHPLPRLEQQARREAVFAGNERDRHARLERLLDQPDLLPTDQRRRRRTDVITSTRRT